jgi:hypothetical protein
MSMVFLPLPDALCSRTCINIPQTAKLEAMETVCSSKERTHTENLISGILSSDWNVNSHFALNFGSVITTGFQN